MQRGLGGSSLCGRPTSTIELSILFVCVGFYAGTQHGRDVLLVDLDSVEVRTWVSFSWERCSEDFVRCWVGEPH